MKFEIVDAESGYGLANALEVCCKDLEDNGNEIIDVKYGGIGFVSGSWGGAEYYTAMIIYK